MSTSTRTIATTWNRVSVAKEPEAVHQQAREQMVCAVDGQWLVGCHGRIAQHGVSFR